MPGFKNIVLAIDLARRRLDLLEKNWVELQRKQVFAETQLTQLQSYSHEVDARWMQTGSTLASPELVSHHHRFMEQLQQALVLQSKVISDLVLQVQEEKKLCIATEIRVRSLSQVLAKKKLALELLQARAEQKQMDEFSASRMLRAAKAYLPGDAP